MKRYEVFSGYRQFYVADAGLEPKAPEDWNDTNVAQRHNTLKHITALCPAGDITARVISCGPGEHAPALDEKPDFEVLTSIEVPSGLVGVYEWPWELKDCYDLVPGECRVRFTGYRTDRVDEQQDYYLVEISEAVLPDALCGDGATGNP